MRQLIVSTSAALALLAGCAAGPGGSDLSAEGELLLTVVSAEEEELRPGYDDLHTDPQRTGEAVDQPSVMRECGAEAILTSLTDRYDADADGTLAISEEQGVWDDREGRSSRGWKRQARRWQLIKLVYDLDGSESIEGDELTALVADFDARCEARQADILAEFDVDGSGDLDATELAAVEDAIAERRAERTGECNRGEGDSQGMGGDSGMGGDRPTQAGGMGRQHGDPGDRLIEAWDTDLDGTLSDSELTVLRDTLTERIRTGEPIRPMDATAG